MNLKPNTIIPLRSTPSKRFFCRYQILMNQNELYEAWQERVSQEMKIYVSNKGQAVDRPSVVMFRG
jgi:hypothetical protein